MQTEIKKRWLRALRSGKYQQSQKYLHKGDSFCCLGVLCDIYLKDKKQEWEKHDGCFKIENGAGGLEDAILPQPVRDWAGLTSENPDVDNTALARHNDDGK